MSLRRTIKHFESYEGFAQFRRSLATRPPARNQNSILRNNALNLAQSIEPRNDGIELREALSTLGVAYDTASFLQVFPLMLFLARTLFRDVSRPISRDIKRQIFEYDGPRFFFVSHTSYYDYALVAQLLHKIGLPVPVMHVAGTVNRGWTRSWLAGLRALEIPKVSSTVEHRAYSWLSAALAKAQEDQVLFARTSRYAVRSRDGVLREPYAPHAVIASVKATGRAMVIPVTVSYSAIPEDQYLAANAWFPNLSALPGRWSSYLTSYLGLRKPARTFRKLEGVFGDVSVDVGRPFTLRDDDSLSLQRVSHRAIEEIARTKLIHPSQLVAKAMQDLDRPGIKEIREAVEREVENTKAFFKVRYRKEPPFHTLITTDPTEAVQRGIKTLAERGALARSTFRRTYYQKNFQILRFYAYHADRRIYPLSGRNTMTVINAGVWGYTLALHIGVNLLRKDELNEHSLVLYDSREELIEKLTVEGMHPWHFKEIPLPRSVRPEADLTAAIGDTSLVMIVTPSKYFYSAITKILEVVKDGSDIVIATKGFIPETGLFPCETARREMEKLGKRVRFSVLSGANLAHEVVDGGPCVTQLACESVETYMRVRPLFETPVFRLVYSDDVIGASISAALKNVYAIGFGLLEGTKTVPENFLATYLTLATAEIRQFGMLLGASHETFDSESQAWLADLLATCRGGRSARFGRDLAAMDEKHGKYLPARHLLEQYRKKKVNIEGFEAARFAHRMATQRGFHPPILGEIYSILHGGKKIDVTGFIERCLDALIHNRSVPMASPIRPRPKRP